MNAARACWAGALAALVYVALVLIFLPVAGALLAGARP